MPFPTGLVLEFRLRRHFVEYCYNVPIMANSSSLSMPVQTCPTPRTGGVSPARHSHLLDRLGAAGSLLCAAHCAAWPLLLALIPALGLSFLASPLFEQGFAAFAGLLATLSLVPGYREHRSALPLLILSPGVLSIGLGAFGPFEHSDTQHAWLMACGGLLVATAHLVNLSRLRRGGECC